MSWFVRGDIDGFFTIREINVETACREQYQPDAHVRLVDHAASFPCGDPRHPATRVGTQIDAAATPVSCRPGTRSGRAGG